MKLGLPEEAETHLQEALVLDPEYIDALITLASLYDESEEIRGVSWTFSYSKEEYGDIPFLNALFGLCL